LTFRVNLDQKVINRLGLRKNVMRGKCVRTCIENLIGIMQSVLALWSEKLTIQAYAIPDLHHPRTPPCSEEWPVYTT
jgi:hypothetical protein